MSVAFQVRVLALRQARGWSQEQAARAAGVNFSTISRLESGSRAPTRDSIDRLAQGYALDAAARDDLLILAGFLPDDPAALIADEPIVAALHRALRGGGLNDARKHHLRALVAEALALATGDPPR